MSYEIIYDKQFIKVKDKFIPMVLSGSNNCYEYDPYTGRERRERTWFNILQYKKKYLWTREELLNYCEEYKNELIERWKEPDKDINIDDKFGSYAGIGISGYWGNTTYKKFKGIFTAGMKRALTIEQLTQYNIFLNIRTYAYDEEKIKKYCKENGIEFLKEHNPKTTQELIDTINKFENNYKNHNVGWSITFGGGRYIEDKLKRIRKELYPRKHVVHNKVETNEYYTIIAENGGYFHRFTKNGYKYSPTTPKYYFLTENKAKRFIKSKNNRSNLTIKKETSTYPIKVTVK